MNSKKILIIVPTDRLAGAETNLKRIALEMKNKGADLTIIFLSRGNNGRWSEIESSQCFYINSPRESIGFIKAIILFFRWRLAGRGFDYSFTSHSHCNAYIGLLTKIRLLKVSSIIYRESTNHFTWLKGKKLKLFILMYKLYADSAFIICQTNKMRKELLTYVSGIKSKQTKVISNPVNYANVRKQSRNIANINNRCVCLDDEVVSVGRLVPEKDYTTLIKAFSLVNNNQLVLRIIGAGPELGNLQTVVKELGLENRVLFTGHIDNPAPFMRKAKLCILSSKLEGYPNVLLEMMCVARRVVATECTDGINGLPGLYTCPPERPEQLASKINEALIASEATVRNNIKKMRKHVKNLTIENFVNDILDSAKELKR